MTERMRRVVLAARPEGRPTEENFRLEEGPVPEPGPGEALVRVHWLSLDPYMRGRMDAGRSYAKPVEVGATMEGGAVGEVIASRCDVPEGAVVLGQLGWTTHATAPAGALRVLDPEAAPPQTALGVLGMPGFTGWYGLTQIGRPQEGETLVVGAATGAVGSMVGQIAKARGLRAVGVAGGPEKCAFAVDELGFDACLDHRAHDARGLREAMAEAAPSGVDVYFENVGGDTLEAVLPLMNPRGRIPVCGMIAWYDLGGLGGGPAEGPDRLAQGLAHDPGEPPERRGVHHLGPLGPAARVPGRGGAHGPRRPRALARGRGRGARRRARGVPRDAARRQLRQAARAGRRVGFSRRLRTLRPLDKGILRFMPP